MLLVDDNPDVRAYVRSVLASQFHVLEAGDGKAGLDLAREALPDLIVADVMMPELDGLGLGRALKADPMTDAIPVILLTARVRIGRSDRRPRGRSRCLPDETVRSRRPHGLRDEPAESTPATAGPFSAGRIGPAIHGADGYIGTRSPASPAGRSAPGGSGIRARGAGLGRLLSYHQLYRSLRDELGTTPTRYIRTVRAECAAALLRQGAGSVTEIAYAVGFESLSYFRRAFRERFEATPSDFLASNANP